MYAVKPTEDQLWCLVVDDETIEHHENCHCEEMAEETIMIYLGYLVDNAVIEVN